VGERIVALAARLGIPRFVAVCSDLMAGADRAAYADELRELTGHETGDGAQNRAAWHDYWVRTWGARGLLHVWDDSATQAVVAGLGDEHWRPLEMCLKVAARHEVAGTGDGAALAATHSTPRVRSAAVRALALVGDREHVVAVRRCLDDEDAEVRRQAARSLEVMTSRLDL
jgi:hypothetical protein